MPFRNPENLVDEADFRQFTREVLTAWLPRVQKAKIAVRIPKPHGLFRLVPQMFFHLRAELFLQLSGSTFFEFPEEEFELGPSEICIVPRGMPHRERVDTRKGPFFNLVFLSGGKNIRFHVAHEFPRTVPGWFLPSMVPSTPSLTALLEEACELPEHRRRPLLAAYFSLILHQMEGWTEPAEPEPFKVTQARQFVSEQLSDAELSVAAVARQVQCSADYLSQIFRKTTGLPLSAYINEHRLIRARELLELSTLNIAEVSQAAGFADPAYFSRIFRRWQGMTPREYRQTRS